MRQKKLTTIGRDRSVWQYCVHCSSFRLLFQTTDAGVPQKQRLCRQVTHRRAVLS